MLVRKVKLSRKSCNIIISYPSFPIAGLDFTQVPSLNVIFGPNDTSKHVRIQILDDDEREYSETFYGNLIGVSSLSGTTARVTTSQAAIEILYNDCKYLC